MCSVSAVVTRSFDARVTGNTSANDGFDRIHERAVAEDEGAGER